MSLQGSGYIINKYLNYNIHLQNTDVSEIRFRSIFEQFGPVDDVSLKLSHDQKVIHQIANKVITSLIFITLLKQGYVFIHYEPSHQGMFSAIEALNHLNDFIHYDLYLHCEPSKNLIDQIFNVDLNYFSNKKKFK